MQRSQRLDSSSEPGNRSTRCYLYISFPLDLSSQQVFAFTRQGSAGVALLLNAGRSLPSGCALRVHSDGWTLTVVRPPSKRDSPVGRFPVAWRQSRLQELCQAYRSYGRHAWDRSHAQVASEQSGAAGMMAPRAASGAATSGEAGAMASNNKSAVTLLHEFCQTRHLQLEIQDVPVQEAGGDWLGAFAVKVRLRDHTTGDVLDAAIGVATSKREAKQQGAAAAFQAIKDGTLQIPPAGQARAPAEHKALPVAISPVVLQSAAAPVAKRAGMVATVLTQLSDFPRCKRLIDQFAAKGVTKTPASVLQERCQVQLLTMNTDEVDLLTDLAGPGMGMKQCTIRLSDKQGQEVAQGTGKGSTKMAAKHMAAAQVLEVMLEQQEQQQGQQQGQGQGQGQGPVKGKGPGQAPVQGPTQRQVSKSQGSGQGSGQENTTALSTGTQALATPAASVPAQSAPGTAPPAAGTPQAAAGTAAAVTASSPAPAALDAPTVVSPVVPAAPSPAPAATRQDQGVQSQGQGVSAVPGIAGPSSSGAGVPDAFDGLPWLVERADDYPRTCILLTTPGNQSKNPSVLLHELCASQGLTPVFSAVKQLPNTTFSCSGHLKDHQGMVIATTSGPRDNRWPANKKAAKHLVASELIESLFGITRLWQQAAPSDDAAPDAEAITGGGVGPEVAHIVRPEVDPEVARAVAQRQAERRPQEPPEGDQARRLHLGSEGQAERTLQGAPGGAHAKQLHPESEGTGEGLQEAARRAPDEWVVRAGSEVAGALQREVPQGMASDQRLEGQGLVPSSAAFESLDTVANGFEAAAVIAAAAVATATATAVAGLAAEGASGASSTAPASTAGAAEVDGRPEGAGEQGRTQEPGWVQQGGTGSGQQGAKGASGAGPPVPAVGGRMSLLRGVMQTKVSHLLHSFLGHEAAAALPPQQRGQSPPKASLRGRGGVPWPETQADGPPDPQPRPPAGSVDAQVSSQGVGAGKVPSSCLGATQPQEPEASGALPGGLLEARAAADPEEEGALSAQGAGEDHLADQGRGAAGDHLALADQGRAAAGDHLALADQGRAAAGDHLALADQGTARGLDYGPGVSQQSGRGGVEDSSAGGSSDGGGGGDRGGAVEGGGGREGVQRRGVKRPTLTSCEPEALRRPGATEHSPLPDAPPLLTPFGLPSATSPTPSIHPSNFHPRPKQSSISSNPLPSPPAYLMVPPPPPPPPQTQHASCMPLRSSPLPPYPHANPLPAGHLFADSPHNLFSSAALLPRPLAAPGPDLFVHNQGWRGGPFNTRPSLASSAMHPLSHQHATPLPDGIPVTHMQHAHSSLPPVIIIAPPAHPNQSTPAPHTFTQPSPASPRPHAPSMCAPAPINPPTQPKGPPFGAAGAAGKLTTYHRQPASQQLQHLQQPMYLTPCGQQQQQQLLTAWQDVQGRHGAGQSPLPGWAPIPAPWAPAWSHSCPSCWQLVSWLNPGPVPAPSNSSVICLETYLSGAGLQVVYTDAPVSMPPRSQAAPAAAVNAFMLSGDGQAVLGSTVGTGGSCDEAQHMAAAMLVETLLVQHGVPWDAFQPVKRLRHL